MHTSQQKESARHIIQPHSAQGYRSHPNPVYRDIPGRKNVPNVLWIL